MKAKGRRRDVTTTTTTAVPDTTTVQQCVRAGYQGDVCFANNTCSLDHGRQHDYVTRSTSPSMQRVQLMTPMIPWVTSHVPRGFDAQQRLPSSRLAILMDSSMYQHALRLEATIRNVSSTTRIAPSIALLAMLVQLRMPRLVSAKKALACHVKRTRNVVEHPLAFPAFAQL